VNGIMPGGGEEKWGEQGARVGGEGGNVPEASEESGAVHQCQSGEKNNSEWGKRRGGGGGGGRGKAKGRALEGRARTHLKPPKNVAPYINARVERRTKVNGTMPVASTFTRWPKTTLDRNLEGGREGGGLTREHSWRVGRGKGSMVTGWPKTTLNRILDGARELLWQPQPKQDVEDV
jgi:hypothetical protein